MRLVIPLFKQSQPHTCLPACVRMVLAGCGREHSEAELVNAFNTVPLWGTRPDNVVTGLENLGCHALWFENAAFERLLELLTAGLPVIVFVRAVDLPHGRAGLHALVAIGFEAEQAICLDPTRDHELRLGLAPFLKAWSGLGYQELAVWV